MKLGAVLKVRRQQGNAEAAAEVAEEGRAGGAARGRRHFLVICPASVAANWAREVAAHSRLPVRVLHSDDRDAGIRTWVADGGVGIVTFPQLGHLRAEGLPRPALLVVDEAHYVKNPAAQRSERTADWAGAAERVLFMSGTPM